MPSEPFIRLDDSGNYSIWKVYMEAELVQKDLWDYVDGSITRPTGSANSKAVKSFLSKSRHARATIIKHLDPSQYPHCEPADPVEIWKKLEMIHVARGFGTRQAMMRRFINMRWSDDQTMEKWISEIRHQANRLKSLEADVTDQWIILALTNGLPARFDSLVESLDSVTPDALTLDYVVTRLLNANAIHRTDAKAHDEGGGGAMAVKLKNWRSGSGGQSGDSSSVRCHNCRGFGHYRKECPSRAGAANSATQVEEDDDDKDFPY